ncbi:MAG: spermidine/putrescine ABC transporter permease PotB [Gammaproteobacteria bacterium]|nr:spermidine/putrescine ABC transporter permease PotB [Gammaproteobacteria bacterium]
MNEYPLFKRFSLGLIWIWLTVFAFLPIVLVITASLLHRDSMTLLRLPFTVTNYLHLFNNAYVKIFLKSFEIAGLSTLLCLLIAYPFAYLIAQTKVKYRSLLLLLVIIPFWTSSLIRTYAIMALLKTKGILNQFLLITGIIHHPLQLLYTETAVFIGLVYDLLPFMILPLYANIEKLDHTLVDAARDLGAKKITIFLRIILPLTMPGILAGIMLVFLPAMTLFFVPVMLGGSKTMLLGNLIQNQFLTSNNWPMGAATSVCLLLIMAVLIAIYWRNSKSENRQDLV